MDEKKIEVILDHYTPEQQTIQAIEELGELQTELAKILNGKKKDYFGRLNTQDLKGELADVYIMVMQLLIIYDIDPEEFDAEMAFKLDRQLARIKEAEEG